METEPWADDAAAALAEVLPPEMMDALAHLIESQTAENERLRGLLSIAREGLNAAHSHLFARGGARGLKVIRDALRSSDPDTASEGETL